MAVPGAQDEITKVVLSWPGASAHPHRFGGIEYRLGNRELGHIHGDQLVDIPFPRRVRDELVASGLARPHHVLPESGWVSLFLENPEDIDLSIELLRRSYALARDQSLRRSTDPAQGG